ncbi:MAG TPA: 50S ribosomal protein L18 [Kiritimatiellia bacterium]|nr:50S ribosomal protein L18 [Kiritimatiellia bacterium]HMP35430.1 50S ribosomal protein L18 [Kiritimatiellia bacterium]
MKVNTKAEYRTRRHLRLRQKVRGTAARPRMSVYVSNQHIYVQFIDDDASRTLAAVSTKSAGMAGAVRANSESARKLGALAAEAAKHVGLKAVVFDRGGFPYRGRIKLMAEAARENGLVF